MKTLREKEKLLVNFSLSTNVFISCHAVPSMFSRFIPSSPNTISPIPLSPEIFPFRQFFFALFLFRPMSVLPFCRFAHFSFRPEAMSPNFPISPNDHFVLFTHGPSPFRPNAIFSDIWAQN